jgi:hypothetical protein
MKLEYYKIDKQYDNYIYTGETAIKLASESKKISSKKFEASTGLSDNEMGIYRLKDHIRYRQALLYAKDNTPPCALVIFANFAKRKNERVAVFIDLRTN